jgi:hypothetical protein
VNGEKKELGECRAGLPSYKEINHQKKKKQRHLKKRHPKGTKSNGWPGDTPEIEWIFGPGEPCAFRSVGYDWECFSRHRSKLRAKGTEPEPPKRKICVEHMPLDWIHVCSTFL